MKRIFTLLVAAALVKVSMAQSFVPGNIVVARVGNGAETLVNTGNSVFLDEYTPAGVLVRSVAMPTTASGTNKQLILSGTATSEGMITRSADGSCLVVAGYARDLGGNNSLSGTTGATVPRVLATVSAAGAINSSTTLSDYASGDNPRCATSTDGSKFWMISGSGGVKFTTLGGTASTTISTTATNIRTIHIFGGQLYTATGSGSVNSRVAAVGTGLPETSTTSTNLPGIPVSGSPYQFFFADLDANTPGVDVLYIADDAAGILKYSLVNGTWTANGSIGAAADTYRGLTGTVTGSVVTLYGVRKSTELVSVTDATGYNAAITATPVLLATAPASTAFRGAAMSPVAATTPLSLLAFNAFVKNAAVQLNWNTANEVNVGQYTIEKAAKGNGVYQAIGTVPAANRNSNSYSFSDVLSEGVRYYRLKMTDRDGSFTYSKVIRVNHATRQSVKVLGNPVQASAVVSHTTAGTQASLSLLTLDGKILLTQQVPAGAVQTTLNLQAYAAGIYLVRYQDGDAVVTEKLVKQ
jgi:hypothetical protein